MKGWDNEQYIILLIILNAVAGLQLVSAIKWPGIARVSFFLLFTWASWTNWTTSQQHPEYKLTTPDLSASQLISAENMIGLLFFNGIEVFFKPKLLWLKAANNDLSQSER